MGSPQATRGPLPRTRRRSTAQAQALPTAVFLTGRATTTQHTEAPELETPESLTPAMDTRLRPMTAIALTRTPSPTSLTTSNINLEAVVPQHPIYLLTHYFC